MNYQKIYNQIIDKGKLRGFSKKSSGFERHHIVPKEKLRGNSNAKGYRHSEEDKLKFSENNSGEKNPFFGKKHTEETKQRLRGPRDKSKKHWAKWRRDNNRKPFPDDWKWL